MFDDPSRVLAEQDWLLLKQAIFRDPNDGLRAYRAVEGRDYPLDDVQLALEDFDGDGRLDAFVWLDPSGLATCAGNTGWCDLEVWRRTDTGWALAAFDAAFELEYAGVYVRTEPDGRKRYFEMAPADINARDDRLAERELFKSPEFTRPPRPVYR